MSHSTPRLRILLPLLLAGLLGCDAVRYANKHTSESVNEQYGNTPVTKKGFRSVPSCDACSENENCVHTCSESNPEGRYLCVSDDDTAVPIGECT